MQSPVNYWPTAKCAKAFWAQQDLPPYQQLLNDTLAWAEPASQECWLDLGCGAGALSRAIWKRTHGTIKAVVGLDCAEVNELCYRRWCDTLSPSPGNRIRFVHHDFASGLGLFADDSFDHAVSGLSISYAESFDDIQGKWTTSAYDRLLSEVWRVIRPGGRFVFSVNVPNPSWAKVAWQSFPRLIRCQHPFQTLKRSWRMLKYGRWLKREARAGRFHYLPAFEVVRRLTAVGFAFVAHRLSYCDQAYIFRATKPA
jgi:SAM-dependent methyltransferase